MAVYRIPGDYVPGTRHAALERRPPAYLAANPVLFGLYHLHKPWMLTSLIAGSLAITWPTRRFRSNWIAIVVHGWEGLLAPLLVLAGILGLMAG